MAKRMSDKKRARETAKYEATHASPPAPRTVTYCSRGNCGAPLTSAADQDRHNQLVHAGGK